MVSPPMQHKISVALGKTEQTRGIFGGA